MYTVYRQTCVCGCTLSITPFYKAQHRSNPGSSRAGWSPSSRKSQKGNPDQNATIQRKSKKGIVLPDLCVFLVSSSVFHMGVSINGGTPIAGWFMMENPHRTWMRTGGTPISGNHHIWTIDQLFEQSLIYRDSPRY